jgi:hypothetical protein
VANDPIGFGGGYTDLHTYDGNDRFLRSFGLSGTIGIFSNVFSMKRIFANCIAFGLCCWIPMTACAQQPAVRVPGTYSNLELNEEAGDLLGIEIKIVPVNNRFQGAVLITEGEPEAMVLVTVNVRGSAVTFDVPGKEGWTFSGRITPRALSGTITHVSGGTEKVVLLRRCGYWDR